MGNNQSRSPLWIIFLFSCLMYPNLFKITIYLWWGSVGNTIEFQFAFCHKIRWNSIFWTTNCWWIIFIFSLLEEQQIVWSLLQLLFGVFMQHALFQTRGVVWWDQTMAVKETTVRVAQMHFIFAEKYLDNRDNRSQNTCVSSDKLGFYFLSLKVK